MGFDAPTTPVREAEAADEAMHDRHAVVLAAARAEGLLGVKDKIIGGRVPAKLLQAAKACSGIGSDSELLIYALSKVALEDDFGRKLVARRGAIPRNLDLEFD